MGMRKRAGHTGVLPAAGLLSLTVLGQDGEVLDRREGYNIITVSGYTLLAQALVWSGLQDQAADLGLTTPTYMTPLYGAVGNGSGTPALTDSTLFAELSREPVGGGAASPATTTVASQSVWSFYFPNPPTTWSVSEAGLFGNATSAANTGTMIDHWAFSPAVSVPTTSTLLLQVGLQFGP